MKTADTHIVQLTNTMFFAAAFALNESAMKETDVLLDKFAEKFVEHFQADFYNSAAHHKLTNEQLRRFTPTLQFTTDDILVIITALSLYGTAFMYQDLSNYLRILEESSK